tara:strand:+ start:5068 stop:5403 length:336 start_codon:yes stop_codon:yes gene_type:complete
MGEQLEIRMAPKDKLLLSWEKAKREDPFLIRDLAKLALDLRGQGHKRWSIDALFHVLRWQRATTIRNHNGLKLNNNHTALAARELMEIYPQLNGFFEVRIRKPRGNWGQIH